MTNNNINIVLYINIYSAKSSHYDLKKYNCETIYRFSIYYYSGNSKITYYYDYNEDQYEPYVDHSNCDFYADGPYRTNLSFETIINIVNNVVAQYPDKTDINKSIDFYEARLYDLTIYDINYIRNCIHTDIDRNEELEEY